MCEIPICSKVSRANPIQMYFILLLMKASAEICWFHIKVHSLSVEI